MAKKKNLLPLSTLDDAVILALRCEYKRYKGRKPGKEYLFWKFAAEYFATMFHETDDDQFFDGTYALVERNLSLMNADYPQEFAAIQEDENLFEIYFANYED